MAKKKQVVQDIPVDKIDEFFRKNYRIIIGGMAIVIAVFIIGYGSYAIMGNLRTSKVETIGVSEAMGFISKEKVAEYATAAYTLTFIKDYIHLRAGEGYTQFNDKDSAIKELSAVSGDLAEYAKSLSYDLAAAGNIDSALLNSGYLAPVWHYRAILAAPAGSRTPLIDAFRTQYPDSVLLKQVEKWGLN
jgi:hypothetical protein